jgi:hypothetical protein
MKSVDSGTFIVFYYEDGYYYRFSITRFYFIEFQGHDCITFFDENRQKLYKKLNKGHILSLVDNQQNVTGFLPKREFFDRLKKPSLKPYA